MLYSRSVDSPILEWPGPVPRRVFKTWEPALPAGWKVRLLRHSVLDRHQRR